MVSSNSFGVIFVFVSAPQLSPRSAPVVSDSDTLQDAEKVLRSVIQGEGSGKIIAKDDKDYGHEHHHPLLGGIATLRRQVGHPKTGRRHDEWKNIDGPSDDGKMRYGIGLREIANPEKVSTPQFDRLPQHGEEAEEDRDLDQHW
jgi:hypothetical protein